MAEVRLQMKQQVGLVVGPDIDRQAPWTARSLDQYLDMRRPIIGGVVEQFRHAPAQHPYLIAILGPLVDPPWNSAV